MDICYYYMVYVISLGVRRNDIKPWRVMLRYFALFSFLFFSSFIIGDCQTGFRGLGSDGALIFGFGIDG